MRKWAIAGMLYVTVVIFSFQVYDRWFAEDKNTTAEAGSDESQEMNMGEGEHGSEENAKVTEGHEEGDHSHESSSSHEAGSEINAFVSNDKNNIKIYLKDKAGNQVDELDVNHEKILHLIIVDEQLKQYYHLHPEKTGNGEFTIKNNLPDGYYKAFIDIKPEHLAYKVEPVPFIVGNPDPSVHGHALEPDTALSKTVDGENVTLNISSIRANEPVKLTFDLDKTNLTPYLGAMGHVVILDEYGKKFLHVHPSNEKEPVFETEFDKPGIYKIWAEFQQNGKVRAFPFVIGVKE